MAYVLTERIRFLKPSVFERHLRTMHATAAVETAGAFRVYHSFASSRVSGSDRRLAPEEITAAADRSGRPSIHLLDGDPRTTWTSNGRMRRGDWIEARWTEPRAVDRVVFAHGRNNRDTPLRCRLHILEDGDWRIAEESVTGELDKFEWSQGHPRYGRATSTFPFGGRLARGVRIEITEPQSHRNWTAAEMEVYIRDDAGGDPPPQGYPR